MIGGKFKRFKIQKYPCSSQDFHTIQDYKLCLRKIGLDRIATPSNPGRSSVARWSQELPREYRRGGRYLSITLPPQFWLPPTRLSCTRLPPSSPSSAPAPAPGERRSCDARGELCPWSISGGWVVITGRRSSFSIKIASILYNSIVLRLQFGLVTYFPNPESITTQYGNPITNLEACSSHRFAVARNKSVVIKWHYSPSTFKKIAHFLDTITFLVFDLESSSISIGHHPVTEIIISRLNSVNCSIF